MVDNPKDSEGTKDDNVIEGKGDDSKLDPGTI